MAAIVRQRAHIVRLVFGVVLWCGLVACSERLVYRPEKKLGPETVLLTDADNLPPIPDPAANNATLAGIDTTGIGIRDDVHLWIYQNYTTTVKRTILLTMAKAVQGVMANPPATTEDARNLEQSYRDAAMMLKIVRGLSKSEAAEMNQFLYLLTINTEERLQSYLRYNLLLQGGNGSR